MTYWLGIDTPETLAPAERKYGNFRSPHPWGFPENRKTVVERDIKVGDVILGYMKRPVSRFWSAWKVTGGYSYDPNNVLAGADFPACREVQLIVRIDPDSGVKEPGVRRLRPSAIPILDEIGERILAGLERNSRAEWEAEAEANREIARQKVSAERAARPGQQKFSKTNQIKFFR